MSSIPFKVKALYDYSSAEPDDLTFTNGQIITVTDEEEEEWYTGEYVDSGGTKHEGLFPRNFVEKYEPLTPPRPTRPNKTKKDPEPVVPVESVISSPPEEPSEPALDEPEPPQTAPVEAKPPASPLPDRNKDSVPQSQDTAPAPESSPAPSAVKRPPPAVAEKPTSGSFRDRIAAFNKPAAAPIAPFKPGGSGGSNFVKKPFVAPPPSKDAYVHQPREPPPKIYRREEDPDIAETESKEIQPTPMATASTGAQEGDSGGAEGDQPKPTSLKERIALLQKQQLEQAARHAEAAQRKEKPKRPPKKRAESYEQPDHTESERPTLERLDSHDTIGKSIDDPEDSPAPKPSARTQKSVDSHLASPPQPSRELVSDTNDADYSGGGDTEDADETSTSKEDSDEKPRHRDTPTKEGVGEEDEASNEEEEEVDPEVKRRMELRNRMAKMSGGFGMMGMFGPSGGMPGVGGGGPRKATYGDSARKPSSEQERTIPVANAAPVPLPGMGRPKVPGPETGVEKVGDEDVEDHSAADENPPEDMPDVAEVETVKPTPLRQSLERGVPPPIPSARAAPPPPTQTRPPPPPAPKDSPQTTPTLPESRPAPPPPRGAVRSPTPGEESDDEMSLGASRLSLNTGATEAPSETKRAAPPIPIPGVAPPMPSRPDVPRSPPSLPQPLASPASPTSKRANRVPPIPLASPGVGSPTQSRPPPPPPPAGDPPSRRSTMDSKGIAPAVPKPHVGNGSDDETTEYDGDYDTDIASGAKHKDALKSHARDSSLDDDTIADEPPQSPTNHPSTRPPPLPATAAPRGVPPPPPPAQPPKSRKSTDAPRGAPPPIPPAKDHSYHESDEYDPYNHNKTLQPVLTSPTEEPNEDDLYETSPVQTGLPPATPPATDRPAPPPPPSHPMHAPPPTRAPPRQSMEPQPTTPNLPRRSMDAPRPSGENSFIAADLDLAHSTAWWTHPNTPPPALINRRDVLYEIEENMTTQRGGKKIVAKDVYILYMDYSQTIINIRFDGLNPREIMDISQRHEPPPSRLRQDQLETAHMEYGSRIADAVATKQNTTVGDGTPQALVLELLRPLAGALLPVGSRAYGALVYANLANASTQQFDEIRPGDIVSFRNAKFQGHRGAMHQKYSVDVGKPDHAGIVVDWDGTKKKVRAWEQGRESKKVKIESFKLSELRSGEVRVWRVMGRSWVGWDSGSK